MNADYLQTLRFKLQRRVRRVNSATFQVFHGSLKQFWAYLLSEPFLRGIIDSLELRSTKVATEVGSILSGQAMVFEIEEEEILGSYLVLKRCAESSNPNIESMIGHLYTHRTEYDEHINSFRDRFLEPLYDYLDEALDEKALMLALLKRYKKRCEWFQRDRMYSLWSEDTQRGEKKLALDLYEYLFEQGINFQIEPKSASGEADLVAAQKGEEPLLADAKIFNPEKGKGKPYLVKGFNQLYTYTRDYNETFGFLVIFKTCEDDLHFVLSEKADSAPFLTHNNKTVFFIVIDLYPYNQPASHRGPLRSIEITGSDLVTQLEEQLVSAQTTEKS